MTYKYSILLPESWTKDNFYTYTSEQSIENGSFVVVPVKTKKATGIVMGTDSENNFDGLREITEILSYKLNEQVINWIIVSSKYTLIPMNQILKMILVSNKNTKPGYLEIQSEVNDLKPGKYPIEMLKMHWNKVRAMMKEGVITETEFPSSDIPMEQDFFSPDQTKAINSIQAITSGTVLLKGSTGSGKTNVYFEILHKIWQQGKQILILVPEISLTYQLIERFHERFKVYPYRWHNSCKQPVWNWAVSGKPGVVIGVRSALWIPFSNLGLIIVDEEHSTTYKQENGPRYNAKDIAILRAKSENIPIILVSATPSLETVKNIRDKNYKCVELERTIPNKLNIKLVKTNKWMSDDLKKHIQETLERKEQVMLFLNRKGFSTHIHCTTCNNRLLCKSCTAGLIFYKNNYTHCSYCSQKQLMPKVCPECQSEDSWKFYGMGIEKIQDQLCEIFPDHKISLLSSDTTEIIDETMHKMQNNEIDILIGTQILAQGCHFPNLTLVGIVQGDIGAHSGDIRNTERMYQLISQVKGRCGRADKPGTVIIQSADDKHPLLQAIAQENTKEWLDQELSIRQNHNLPPFSRMIRIIIGSKSAALTEKIVMNIKKPTILGVEIMGPAPTQLHKYNNDYRWSFLIQYSKNIFPQAKIKQWIDGFRLPKNVRLTIDVDPQSFF
ncbi:primosomal protein N' [Candidatus Cytomitobacter indipagum]|uniref:Replication restart protein PriA n=1 Tax=Candidatus Cytomitobacter indipagum TaxID=2601575 RepID=A0A5C0UEX7_9PROT|nr:primosomal protein N' [Candidatus Cytomitobacter indipagum]QEK38260.1 primosomal protein N' [Candidatus Cytomitobacter indipagum]